MLDKKLRIASLWIAITAGTVALAAVFLPAVRTLAVEPMMYLTGSAFAVLFVRILFTRVYREGIDKINREMQGDDPWPGKAKKLSDPDWGIFGKKAGYPLLLNVRAVLFFGSIPAGLLQNLIGPEVFHLWFAGAMLSIQLSLMFAVLMRLEEET